MTYKTYKRMVRFLKRLFLTLYGHNIHYQQWKLSEFLMSYQQFASHAYSGAANQYPRWRHSRRWLSACFVLRCPDLSLQSSVNFVHGLKHIILVWCACFRQCTKLTQHCNHRSGHLKT
jgi:hypothetical protein